MEEDRSFRIEVGLGFSDFPDEGLRPGGVFLPVDLDGQAHNNEKEEGRKRHGRQDHRKGDPEEGQGRFNQHERTECHGDDPSNGENAVTDDQRFGDKEDNGKED